ncbi:MAG: ABC transporter substrate-binding protein [Oscillospiraceae bacterium]|jgi:raffinose/stachyose/melibiose transport system substrate-binding protein
MKAKQILAGIAALLLLASCSPAPQEVNEKTVLKFCYIYERWSEETTSLEIYRAIDRFCEENSNFRVEIVALSEKELDAGKLPEADLYWDCHRMKQNIREERYLNLKPYLDQDTEWKDGFRNGAFQQASLDGGIYGVPVFTVYDTLFYNVELFEKNGINAASIQTWEDFLAVCEMLKQADILPLALMDHVDGRTNLLFDYLVQRLGGLEAVYALAEDREGATFEKECFVHAAEMVRELFEKEYALSNVEANADQDPEIALFKSGEAAMCLVENEAITGNWSDNVYEYAEVISFPILNADKGDWWMEESNSYIAVSSQTAYPDAAVEMLKYMTGKQVQEGLLSWEHVVPAAKYVEYDPSVSYLSRGMQTLVNSTKRKEVQTFSRFNLLWGADVDEICNRGLVRVVRGEQTPQEAMRSAQEEYEQLRNSVE